jgi:hypothetical protein
MMSGRFTILVGAGLIAAAIIASRLIAPFSISAGTGADNNPLAWRVNAITGDCPDVHLYEERRSPSPFVRLLHFSAYRARRLVYAGKQPWREVRDSAVRRTSI